MSTPLVVLGVAGAPHGVRGELRVKTFTENPLSLGDYGPLHLADGRRFKVLSVRPGGEVVIVRLEGINDRNAAEALKGLTLGVPRDALPAPTDDDDFYHADLIGLRCETADGALVGTLVAINDFGAGDVLDIRPPSGPHVSLGFTRANVPTIDLASGRIIVVLPHYTEARSSDD